MASGVEVTRDKPRSNMRTPKSRRSRPNSQQGNPPVRSQPRPMRKVFNCIVDDTALVAGVKRSTRNGIRQWVKHGQIRLFVPLHALEELSRQKVQKSRHGDDVRETLQWLDEATTKHPDVVTLQGADETYERWAEVEKFAVPRTLFSEYNYGDLDLDVEQPVADGIANLAISHNVERGDLSSQGSDITGPGSPASDESVRSSASPISPPTSPAKAPTLARQSPDSASQMERPSRVSGTVPRNLQSLFNYILWRIHQELDPVAALESFIFLCNDSHKMSYAKGFDIKTKRLEQLREAISREDRDYKNRQALLSREQQAVEPSSKRASKSPSLGSDDADSPFLGSTSPVAPAANIAMSDKTNMLDPDSFGRNLQTGALVEQSTTIEPRSPRPVKTHVAARGSPRLSTTAQPSNPRSSNNNAGRVRGGSSTNTRNRGVSRGAGRDPVIAADALTQSGTIDPDSFARPNPRSGPSTARGGRKLWVPK